MDLQLDVMGRIALDLLVVISISLGFLGFLTALLYSNERWKKGSKRLFKGIIAIMAVTVTIVGAVAIDAILRSTFWQGIVSFGFKTGHLLIFAVIVMVLSALIVTGFVIWKA